MPELPEVETVRRGLLRFLKGKQILKVDVLCEKSFFGDISKITGWKVLDVRRRGKALMIDLDGGVSLVGHLKMTGQMVLRGFGEEWGAGHPNKSFSGELPDNTTRVVFEFVGDGKLFFNDQRKFGWIKVIPTTEVMDMKFLSEMGPEPFDKTAEDEFVKRIIRRQKTTIKAALLDQGVLAGVGNIYADEGLWLAKVHPATRVGDLSEKKLREIFRAARDTMKVSIKNGGSSMRNYIKADGTKGNYLEKFAKVFRREGLACPRCSTKIVKMRVAGRGTHVCPKCQKIK